MIQPEAAAAVRVRVANAGRDAAAGARRLRLIHREFVERCVDRHAEPRTRKLPA